jgi:hypothetical protein
VRGDLDSCRVTWTVACIHLQNLPVATFALRS